MGRKFWISVMFFLQMICTISVIVDARLDLWDHTRGAVMCGINLVCMLVNVVLIGKEYRLWEKKSL